MTLEEYAKLHPASDIDSQIYELESQLWYADHREPQWVIRQTIEHNNEILRRIQILKEQRNHEKR